jgi:hypothetical protein
MWPALASVSFVTFLVSIYVWRFASRNKSRMAHGSQARRSNAALLASAISALSLSAVAQAAPLPASSTGTAFAAGSYIVDMGLATQTIANGVKPYGLVYDLIVNKKIPVSWAISDTKLKDGTDFTVGIKDYRGGPFIIPAEYAAEAAATIATWRAKGVVIDGPTTSGFNAPVYARLTSYPHVVLDSASASIVTPLFTNAGIPATSYRTALPSALTGCDDMYIMPHADPTWVTHKNLVNFNKSGGYIWAGCHAVSVLESLDGPDVGTLPDTNFLSQAGLVNYGLHDDATPPYTYQFPNTPVGQFIGVTDAAQLNGSEQIYLPASPGWRSTTQVVSYDPQADVPTLSPGPATAIAVGPGYGDPANGYVMYEGGHSLNGTAPDYVAAQRAFFNFQLMAGISAAPRSPKVFQPRSPPVRPFQFRYRPSKELPRTPINGPRHVVAPLLRQPQHPQHSPPPRSPQMFPVTSRLL